MALFAAGIALVALLFASYSRRRTWLACASAAMSVALLAGGIFLATTDNPSQVKARLAWLANELAPVLDRQTVDALKTAIAHASIPAGCGGEGRPACVAAADRTAPDGDATGSAEPPARQAMQAAATPSWLETKPEAKPEPKATPGSPVIWHLGEANALASASSADGALIRGVNVSDQALSEVQATLKPDGSQQELALALKVEGQSAQGETVIPAGARFGLGYDAPDAGRPAQLAGATFKFRYTYAGRQKATILYLTPSMIAQTADRR